MLAPAEPLPAGMSNNAGPTHGRGPRRLTTPFSGRTALRALDGADIVKRGGAARRLRYLVSLPGVLRPLSAAGGVVGRLTQLDGPHPRLDVALPTGRVRLYGAFVRIKAPLVALRARARQNSTRQRRPSA